MPNWCVIHEDTPDGYRVLCAFGSETAEMPTLYVHSQRNIIMRAVEAPTVEEAMQMVEDDTWPDGGKSSGPVGSVFWT